MSDSNNLQGGCQSPPLESSSSAESSSTAESLSSAESSSTAESSSSVESSEQKLGVIYKITNTLDGKIYVGRTQQKLSRRIYKHKYEAKRGRPGVDAAIAKYGWEHFTVEVIETCPIEQLNEREIFWIAELKSKSPNGYNLTDGGDGCTGFKHTEESRAKISANHADFSGENNPQYGKPLSEEHKAKISANHADVSGENNPNYGKKPSLETLAKMSASKTGENNPNYGKPRSPETCAKISVANKGKPSPLKGKKRSPEIIAKIKATWAKKKLEKGGK